VLNKYLQGKLATVQHRTLERIRCLLQISLGTLPRTDQVFQNSRKKTFSSGRLYEQILSQCSQRMPSETDIVLRTIVGRLDVIVILFEAQAINGGFIH